jgi:hypothetical protein
MLRSSNREAPLFLPVVFEGRASQSPTTGAHVL